MNNDKKPTDVKLATVVLTDAEITSLRAMIKVVMGFKTTGDDTEHKAFFSTLDHKLEVAKAIGKPTHYINIYKCTNEQLMASTKDTSKICTQAHFVRTRECIASFAYVNAADAADDLYMLVDTYLNHSIAANKGWMFKDWYALWNASSSNPGTRRLVISEPTCWPEYCEIRMEYGPAVSNNLPVDEKTETKAEVASNVQE